MLPSRGLIRPCQGLRLRPVANTQAGCARAFGTALRGRNGTATARAAVPSLSISQLSGRRIVGVASAKATMNGYNSPSATAAAFSLFPWTSSPKKESALPFESTAPQPPPPPPSAHAADAAAQVSSAPQPPPTGTLSAADPASSATSTVSSSSTVDPASYGAAAPADYEAALAELLDRGSALLDLPEQIGYLKAMGLDFGWGPTSACQWLFEHIHIYAGLPWWASVAAMALLFRVAIFFPSLTAAEHSAKFQQLRQDPKYAAVTSEMQQAAFRGGVSQARAMELRMELQRMQQASGVSVMKTFIPMLNIPFGIAMFRVLRSMALIPVPAWEHAGLLWFTDLTVPDPYFILPVASAGIMYLIMKNNMKYMAPEQAQTLKIVQMVITPLSIAVTCQLSAGLTFFFFVSSLLQLVQSWLWHQPWLRNWAGLPPLQALVPGGGGGGAPGGGAAAAQPAFRLAPGSSWQAPRAIDATARNLTDSASASRSAAEAASASAAPKQPPTTVEVLKKGWDKLKGTTQESKGLAKDRQALRKADDYEKKRAAEDEDGLYRRREADRQYREMRKAMAKGENNTNGNNSNRRYRQ